jgi:hypothetical protein
MSGTVDATGGSMSKPAGLLLRQGFEGCLLSLLLILSLIAGAKAAELQGSIVDHQTGLPIFGATITSGEQIGISDANGKFHLEGAGPTIRVRAAGYWRIEIAQADALGRAIALEPLRAKGLYLTVYGIGVASLRDPALAVIAGAGLNAIVIDVKGDRGLVPYPSKVPLAAQVGALKVRTVGDLAALVAGLKARGLYTIARVVVFKDTLLAQAMRQWAIRSAKGVMWRDREGLAWIDPYQTAAWDYSLSIAEEAAASGFDEIQFDYIRFPDATGLAYAKTSTQAQRVGAIVGYLGAARRRLQRYNVFIAIDVFGYVCWNSNDTFIGQKLEDLAGVVDYISPMLYPSSFQFGIPGHRNPVLSPYDVVHDTLVEAMHRTAGSAVRYRPWLQAFPDYAFDRRRFAAGEIAAQIKASNHAGAIGWMLWNPRNVYSTDGVMPEQTSRR